MAMAGGLTARQEHAQRLGSLPRGEWPGYLRAHSGLPGPRGNLELADAFTGLADRDEILRFAGSADEFERFCGTQSIGRLMAEDPADDSLVELLRERASDGLWRVREAAARALQFLGDRDPARLAVLVRAWVGSRHPFVRRAAIAAICEPRLLDSPELRHCAIEACQTATTSIAALPADQRRASDVRNLRQALGYCWSVAVASDPGPGLAAFRTMAADADPDLRWIVMTNLKKARLQRVLATGPTAL